MANSYGDYIQISDFESGISKEAAIALLQQAINTIKVADVERIKDFTMEPEEAVGGYAWRFRAD